METCEIAIALKSHFVVSEQEKWCMLIKDLIQSIEVGWICRRSVNAGGEKSRPWPRCTT